MKFVSATKIFLSAIITIALLLPSSSYSGNRNTPLDAGEKNEEVTSLFVKMHLQQMGLSFKAFNTAWNGFEKLNHNCELTNPTVLSIADFTQSSNKKRLYVIDVANEKILFQTFVAHGINSGEEFAQSFSNQPESHKTSLGFYVTGDTYDGEHGLSLRLEGKEHGINDGAMDRGIVIHGADYVSEKFIRSNGRLGRSFGCPAIPYSERDEIINTIKDGSCFFIYYPDANYLKRSLFR